MVFVNEIITFCMRGCWIKEVVGVHCSIGRFPATLPSKKINTPPQIHVLSEISISDYQLTHTLFKRFSGYIHGFLVSIFKFC